MARHSIPRSEGIPFTSIPANPRPSNCLASPFPARPIMTAILSSQWVTSAAGWPSKPRPLGSKFIRALLPQRYFSTTTGPLKASRRERWELALTDSKKIPTSQAWSYMPPTQSLQRAAEAISGSNSLRILNSTRARTLSTTASASKRCGRSHLKSTKRAWSSMGSGGRFRNRVPVVAPFSTTQKIMKFTWA